MDGFLAFAKTNLAYVFPDNEERCKQMKRYLDTKGDKAKESLLYDAEFINYMVWSKKIYSLKPLRDLAYGHCEEADDEKAAPSAPTAPFGNWMEVTPNWRRFSERG